MRYAAVAAGVAAPAEQGPHRSLHMSYVPSSVAETSAASARVAVLDADALDRLRELDPQGQSRLVERVLRAFESSASRLARQFAEARRAGDMQGIRHVVHTLKSSSASIGALALARLCAEIESAIRAETFATLAERLDALDRELAAVLQAVTPMLASPGTTP
jgi:HPt (histidine-containing phosphotransfer) domain-containing protein